MKLQKVATKKCQLQNLPKEAKKIIVFIEL